VWSWNIFSEVCYLSSAAEVRGTLHTFVYLLPSTASVSITKQLMINACCYKRRNRIAEEVLELCLFCIPEQVKDIPEEKSFILLNGWK